MRRWLRLPPVRSGRLAAFARDVLYPRFLEDCDAVAVVVRINSGGVAPRLELHLRVTARKVVFLVVAHCLEGDSIFRVSRD